MYFSSNI